MGARAVLAFTLLPLLGAGIGAVSLGSLALLTFGTMYPGRSNLPIPSDRALYGLLGGVVVGLVSGAWLGVHVARRLVAERRAK